MPPRVGPVPTPFIRIFTSEASAFLAARAGEQIIRVAPNEIIERILAILPDSILATPDAQKDFARYAKAFVLVVTGGDIKKGDVVQEFLTESLEEIKLRKDEFESARQDRRKVIVHEAFTKHAAKLDKLRATPATATVTGRNLPDAIAQLTKHKQREFYDWFNALPNDNRQFILERWSNIIVTEERAMSIIDANAALRYTLLKDLVEHAPKSSPGKSRIDSAIEKITAVGSEWVDPGGKKMEEFAQKREDSAKEHETVVRRRGSIF